MPASCRTCEDRTNDLNTISTTPTLVDVCLITLTFSNSNAAYHQSTCIALNTLLNDIKDSGDFAALNRFILWSPWLCNSRTIIILTTASETCSKSTSPIYQPVLQHLSTPPKVQNIRLDYSVLSLANSTTHEGNAKIPCDIITLSATEPNIASEIGKRFGWNPKQSSLTAKINTHGPFCFGRSGDLIRDFWAWTGAPPGYPTSPSSASLGSDDYSYDTELHEDEDETLVMIFQWSSHKSAERFKNPLMPSYGLNEEQLDQDMWDACVARPVRSLDELGADVHCYSLQLQNVEDRIGTVKESKREISHRRKLSDRAAELGERISGWWK
ncbi:hypothetical protein P154DRAFT_528015 [Amniculicola lignicola CBS 123094]|uniref:Uncharacterized protein n=1 Tax=Amniculicola lignicola CBS 123094 TaxID=1392246 RepID=A0A6A5VZ28_9PLEO|nr:hypothetical protein P154DRAFT_528015 [Amniculicola lignicola CBS 123094]